jgi:trypsin
MGRIKVALLLCLVPALLLLAPVAHAQFQPRIVGGSATTIEQYPWQAAVVLSPAKVGGDAHDRQFCGGSLITASIVLTAAHCLYDDDPDCDPDDEGVEECEPSDPGGDGTKRVDPDDVDVVLGVTQLSTAAPEDEHEVQDVSFHPGFDEDTFQNDVGYLVLDAPVTTGPAIQTIDLAGDDEAPVWAPNTPVDISGWGSTVFDGDTVDVLRAAKVPIVTDSTCGSSGVYGSAFDPATMVCAGFPEGGVDSCQGDSGGPLASPLEGGEHRLVGVTSWGFRCAEPDAPGVYARIAQAAPGGLRDDIVATVTELNMTYELPPETIVGSGGQPQRPANDDFANAVEILGSLPQTVSGNNVHSTVEEPDEPAHGGSDLGSVWYEWTASVDMPVRLNACSATGPGPVALAVWTGADLASLTEVAQFQSCRAYFDANGGQTYEFAVDTFGSLPPGPFSLLVREANPPANDDLANAQVITGNSIQNVAGTTVDATTEMGEPNHIVSSGPPGPPDLGPPASVWYSWTSGSGGGIVTIDGCPAGVALAVYTGDSYSPPLVPVTPINGSCSQSFPAAPSTTYKIAVEGLGDGAAFVLNPPAPPPPGGNQAPPASPPGATGKRAAALKKCKKKRGKARKKCMKRAKRLPV